MYIFPPAVSFIIAQGYGNMSFDCVDVVTTLLGSTAELSCSYSLRWPTSSISFRWSFKGGTWDSSRRQILECDTECSYRETSKYRLNITRSLGAIRLLVFQTNVSDIGIYECGMTSSEGIRNENIGLTIQG